MKNKARVLEISLIIIIFLILCVTGYFYFSNQMKVTSELIPAQQLRGIIKP